MNLVIMYGRTRFWQWDAGQKLVIDDDTCGQVHFCNGTTEKALITKIYSLEDGTRVADVPNILLQVAKPITAYLYRVGEDSQETRVAYRFDVTPRTKPDDYVYTETELLGYTYLDGKITDLEKEAAAFAEQVYTREQTEAVIRAAIEKALTDLGQSVYTKEAADQAISTAIDAALADLGADSYTREEVDQAISNAVTDASTAVFQTVYTKEATDQAIEAAVGEAVQAVGQTVYTKEETESYIQQYVESYIEEALGGDY
jgi:uncharacterized membrane-anchored protein YjiN (DUF445 family)